MDNHDRKRQKMKTKNIVLITPPGLHIIPIGFEIIASYFDAQKIENNKLREYSISIIHGSDISKEEIIRIYNSIENPVYVGITSWQSHHEISMDILKEIKKITPNIKTIVGGPNCYYAYKQILKNNDFVDFVVRGPGEKALVDIVDNNDLENATNLIYRENNEIRLSTKQGHIDLASRTLFDLRHIVNKKNTNYVYKWNTESSSITLKFPVANIYGCIEASLNKQRCSFCSLPGLLTKINSPKKFWAQIRLLREKYGITHYFETGDSFLIGNYPEAILKEKPSDLDVFFRVYTSPSQITYEKLEVLKKIGVGVVFIGVENINQEIQYNLAKKVNEELVENIMDLLAKFNMKAMIGYIYGLPGESKATINNSNAFLKKLVDKYSNNIVLMAATIVTPMIGSDLYNGLLNNEKIISEYSLKTNNNLTETDIIDYDLLQRLMIDKGDFNFTFEELKHEYMNVSRYISEATKAYLFL